MEHLELYETLADDEANRFYTDVLVKADHITQQPEDPEETDVLIVTQDAEYEVNFQYDDDIACHIQRTK